MWREQCYSYIVRWIKIKRNILPCCQNSFSCQKTSEILTSQNLGANYNTYVLIMKCDPSRLQGKQCTPLTAFSVQYQGKPGKANFTQTNHNFLCGECISPTIFNRLIEWAILAEDRLLHNTMLCKILLPSPPGFTFGSVYFGSSLGLFLVLNGGCG